MTFQEGRFRRSVAQACLLISTSPACSIPACSRPMACPPAPAHNSSVLSPLGVAPAERLADPVSQGLSGPVNISGNSDPVPGARFLIPLSSSAVKQILSKFSWPRPRSKAHCTSIKTLIAQNVADVWWMRQGAGRDRLQPLLRFRTVVLDGDVPEAIERAVHSARTLSYRPIPRRCRTRTSKIPSSLPGCGACRRW